VRDSVLDITLRNVQRRVKQGAKPVCRLVGLVLPLACLLGDEPDRDSPVRVSAVFSAKESRPHPIH
jgi:hypothetical protein